MADIEFVIKISEEVKNRLCFGVTYPKDIQAVCEAFNNGTPLPKGHGRLIDVDDLIQELSVVSSRPIKSQLYILRDAPTIIEADKAGMTLTEYPESISPLNDKKLSWLGKSCKDCGNKKCKELGELPKGYDCALWRAESEYTE